MPGTSANTREAILGAADQLFGEVGFENASTRLIGERSGVNKALIHYHFKDKSELWAAVLDRYYERLESRIQTALARAGDLQGRMLGLLESYLDFLAENRTFARMVQREVAGGRHVERVTAHMAPLFETGAALLNEAYPATREGPLSAAQLLVSFYGMAVTWVTYAPVVESLAGTDPLGDEGLALRKAHLAKMVDLVVAELQAATHNAAASTAKRRRKS